MGPPLTKITWDAIEISMIVISYGMVRSASSFSFQLIQEIIRLGCKDSGGKLYSLGGLIDRINGNFVDNSEDLASIVKELCNHSIDFDQDWVVINTHSPCNSEITRLLRDGKILAVANYRHPAEVALSLRDIAKSEKAKGINRFNQKYINLDSCINGVRFHAKTFLAWNKVQMVHKIFYDNIVTNPQTVCHHLSNYLGFDKHPKRILKKFQSGNATIRELNKGVLDRKSSELTALELAKFENVCPKLMTVISKTLLY